MTQFTNDQLKFQISHINEQKNTINGLVEQALPSFRQYITNTELPLEERWNFWVTAPTELKKHSEWVTENTTIRSFVEGIYHITKGSKINLDTFLTEVAADKLLCYEEDIDDTDEFKEAVLQENLGSYCMFWE